MKKTGMLILAVVLAHSASAHEMNMLQSQKGYQRSPIEAMKFRVIKGSCTGTEVTRGGWGKGKGEWNGPAPVWSVRTMAPKWSGVESWGGRPLLCDVFHAREEIKKGAASKALIS